MLRLLLITHAYIYLWKYKQLERCVRFSHWVMPYDFPLPPCTCLSSHSPKLGSQVWTAWFLLSQKKQKIAIRRNGICLQMVISHSLSGQGLPVECWDYCLSQHMRIFIWGNIKNRWKPCTVLALSHTVRFPGLDLHAPVSHFTRPS